jgi:filamin
MDFEGINLFFLFFYLFKEIFVLLLLALIRTPTGKFHTPIIDDNHDGTVSIKYQPAEIGLHELDVFYQGQPIAGSPFKFHVDQVQTGYVTAYGPGLSHGVCNESSSFRIVTKDAGSGGLSVAVEGSSKAEIQCKDNKDGTCDVTYWPVIYKKQFLFKYFFLF